MFSVIIMNYAIKRLLNQHGSNCQFANKIRDRQCNNTDKYFSVNKGMCKFYVFGSIFVTIGAIALCGNNFYIEAISCLSIAGIAIILTAILDVAHYPLNKRIFRIIKDYIANSECRCPGNLLLENNQYTFIKMTPIENTHT